ncbi:hypothetical protein CAPTEDRAFT_80827, partial [Capitella teleta]
SCSEHWTARGDKCYRVFTEQMTWKKAEENCIGLGIGAKLASISSAEEQQFVDKQLLICEDLWSGLIFHHRDSMLAWTNGNSVSFTNWAPGEPNVTLEADGCVRVN